MQLKLITDWVPGGGQVQPAILSLTSPMKESHASWAVMGYWALRQQASMLVKSDFTGVLVPAESEVVWNFPLMLLPSLLPYFQIFILLQCSLYANKTLLF